jgi:SdpI/YfhL protein family
MPLVFRLILGSVLVLTGGTLLTVGVLGARSRLRRNRWIGIRTPATLRSEPAFARAHRVGAVPAAAAGAIALVGGLSLLAGSDSAVLDGVVLAVSALGAFGLAGFAARAGDRAAAAVQPEPVAGCAGSCAGCDLVAGCRDRQPAGPAAGPRGPADPSRVQPADGAGITSPSYPDRP